MGDRLRVFLTREADHTLFELRCATTVPQKLKDSAEGEQHEKVGSGNFLSIKQIYYQVAL
jgi:hypothetical protein